MSVPLQLLGVYDRIGDAIVTGPLGRLIVSLPEPIWGATEDREAALPVHRTSREPATRREPRIRRRHRAPRCARRDSGYEVVLWWGAQLTRFAGQLTPLVGQHPQDDPRRVGVTQQATIAPCQRERRTLCSLSPCFCAALPLAAAELHSLSFLRG